MEKEIVTCKECVYAIKDPNGGAFVTCINPHFREKMYLSFGFFCGWAERLMEGTEWQMK